MKTIASRILLGGSICAAVMAAAMTTGSAQGPDFGAVKASEMKWGPLDPKQPNGIQAAVLAGDPSKPGTFVMRIKFPAGFEVASHQHSTTEYGSVLSGRMLVAFGVKPDKAKAIELRAGDFFFLKGGQHHQVWAVDETVLDFSAEGPFDIHYD